ncbi:response regulator [Chloroflexus sp. MS-CIW-1]|jgi:CheY-like chemotaxis protein|uniref:response regulator n=1 Tax=Chloroflexus sp. MS-CIW-1 TaxID=3055768 RepID=UPI001B01C5F7|nr:response regulator [Chloroflexus sp. MS-CIW-1]MBO9346638.1 response regulator [Chloroflexus sp.]MDN5271483.1 response regulator [Chloroflexus sp. MS-CIW-1]
MTTIMIVDDYAPTHRLMSFVLEQHGYTVITAIDGEQALSRLYTHTVDLVVTDLTMPRMDGIELVRAIRADERYTRLPIIMITGTVKEQDEVKAAGVGVNAFLTKPVDSDDLVNEVDRLLHQESSRYGA